ncbi:hypothetical protein Dimus_032432 [Dionaea muscipula]
MLDFQAHPFHGVRFALFGFDPIKHEQVRSKLLSLGGVDAGQYGANCTHVIVDKLVYDDPVCIAATTDGKTLINSLWVDHSLDVGMPVDVSSIMYRPVKDLNGIPGAKDFVMCLTGYQRHDRDDIMTLVSLMGAQFSKPLVANRVTHLICYKFEGEKYELAKRIKKIKLVNHLWLEDCLKAWKILPEESYSKSGYELEMEAEAKDSQEEAPELDAKPTRVSPRNLQNKSPVNQNTPIIVSRLPNAEPAALSIIGNNKDVMPLLKSEMNSDQAIKPNYSNQMHQLKKKCGIDDVGGPKFIEDRPPNTEPTALSNIGNNNDVTPPQKSEMNSDQAIKLKARCGIDDVGALKSNNLLDQQLKLDDDNDAKLSGFCYSRKTPRKSRLSLHLAGESKEDCGKDDVSCVPLEAPRKGTDLPDEVGLNCSLFPKRKMNGNIDFSPPRSKFQRLNSSAEKTPASLNSSFEMGKEASFIPEKRLVENSSPISRSLTKDLVDGGDPMSSDVPATSVTKEKDACHDQKHNADVIKSKSPMLDASKSPMLDATHVLDPCLGKSTRKASTKKTLGSRRSKLNGANPAIQVQVGGSLSLTKNSTRENASFLSVPEIGAVVSPANLADAFRGETVVSPRDHVNAAADLQMNDVLHSARKAYDNAQSELEKLGNEGKADEAGVPTAAAEENAKGTTEIQQKTGICNEKPGPGASGSEGGPTNHKRAEKRKPRPASTRVLEPKTPVGGIGKRKRVLQSSDNTSHGMTSGKKLQPTLGKENENQPVVDNKRDMILKDGKQIGSSSAKSRKTTKKSTKMSGSGNSPLQSGHLSGIVTKEPAWFILSGHRLQRKEFQRVIKTLKGKLCRDSHQWSYQATHFIVPGPIRRTEKFFAAVASGCWILKTDYLSASNEAGKLLPEEPYEWHKNGLSEDGAINLEAPRKWRIMKERTGHGAFHGMRIVIYGDCIVPSLDTLKRVVKAGDGTILATSPPYTRFLKSEVDFAIVSPGITRVDPWVQEFLRHEIPCVLTDYLVEYVCKPGYPLEKHVLYNTQNWAARSFTKLASYSEIAVEAPGSPDNKVSNGE